MDRDTEPSTRPLRIATPAGVARGGKPGAGEAPPPGRWFFLAGKVGEQHRRRCHPPSVPQGGSLPPPSVPQGEVSPPGENHFRREASFDSLRASSARRRA